MLVEFYARAVVVAQSAKRGVAAAAAASAGEKGAKGSGDAKVHMGGKAASE